MVKREKRKRNFSLPLTFLLILRQKRLILFLIVCRKQRPLLSLKAVSGHHLLPWAPADFCRARALPCSPVNTCNLSCKRCFPKLLLAFAHFYHGQTTTRGTSWSTNERRFTRHTPKGWFLPTCARLLYTKHERESIVHVPVRRINLVIAA